jgi:hypothetical protein
MRRRTFGKGCCFGSSSRAARKSSSRFRNVASSCWNSALCRRVAVKILPFASQLDKRHLVRIEN